MKEAIIKITVDGEVILTTASELKTLERKKFEPVHDLITDVQYDLYEKISRKEVATKLTEEVEKYRRFCKAMADALKKSSNTLNLIIEDLEKEIDLD